MAPFLTAISTVISGSAWFSTTNTVSPVGVVCCWMLGTDDDDAAVGAVAFGLAAAGAGLACVAIDGDETNNRQLASSRELRRMARKLALLCAQASRSSVTLWP